jgi:hypothetical protein
MPAAVSTRSQAFVRWPENYHRSSTDRGGEGGGQQQHAHRHHHQTQHQQATAAASRCKTATFFADSQQIRRGRQAAVVHLPSVPPVSSGGKLHLAAEPLICLLRMSYTTAASSAVSKVPSHLQRGRQAGPETGREPKRGGEALLIQLGGSGSGKRQPLRATRRSKCAGQLLNELTHHNWHACMRAQQFAPAWSYPDFQINGRPSRHKQPTTGSRERVFTHSRAPVCGFLISAAYDPQGRLRTPMYAAVLEGGGGGGRWPLPPAAASAPAAACPTLRLPLGVQLPPPRGVEEARGVLPARGVPRLGVPPALAERGVPPAVRGVSQASHSAAAAAAAARDAAAAAAAVARCGGKARPGAAAARAVAMRGGGGGSSAAAAAAMAARSAAACSCSEAARAACPAAAAAALYCLSPPASGNAGCAAGPSCPPAAESAVASGAVLNASSISASDCVKLTVLAARGR